MLTGINSAASATATAGFDLPRLVREAGETPGLDRLRLSSIEINHVSDALVSAMLETRSEPAPARPLQSGDDGVLTAMRRRYTVRTFLRRLEPLADEFNLTWDVIVGFPAEDAAAFARTLRTVERAGQPRCTCSPTRRAPAPSPQPTTGPAPAKRAQRPPARALARLYRRRWRRSSARRLVLVDRPGRGYGDDYSPWLLVDAPWRARPRAGASAHGGGHPCRRSVTIASSAARRNGDYVHRAKGFVAINDINPQAPVHCS